MPAKRRRSTKKRRGKRIKWSNSRYYRRRSGRRSANTIRLLRGPVAKRAIAKLNYCTAQALTSSVGGWDKAVFRANSVHDPEAKLGGHQPMGHDQLMANYNHYTVLGSKITVTCFHAATTSPGYISITLEGGSGTTHDPDDGNTCDMSERRRCHWKWISGSNTGKRRGVVKFNFSTKKFFSCKAVVGEDSYKGGIGSDPDEQAFFHVRYCSPEDTGNTQATIKVRMQYLVMYTEPKYIDQS